MIQPRSMLQVADNSGAKKVQCIKVRGGYKKRYGCIGDIVTVSVKIAQPHSMVKKGEVYQAVLVRARKETRRKDGSYIRFSDNAVVLLTDKEGTDIKGTRILGPVAREIRQKGFQKIISLAQEVL